MNMDIWVAYIAKGIVLVLSMILYVYLFSVIIPKFIMRLKLKKENTQDRGLKKFVYSNGRCVLYETELSARKYISNYALYTEDGYKYIKCLAVGTVRNLSYDIYAFDNRNKLIDIIAVSEVLGEERYTTSVALPPETSYVRFVLRKVDNEYSCKKVYADYSIARYIICASLVALATAFEASFMYKVLKDILINALQIKLELSSSLRMIVTVTIISLVIAGLTVLAYLRNSKKVINR